MFKRVKKISTVCMGAFSIISLIQNGSPKMPTKVNPSNQIVSKGTTVGNRNEGVILFSSGSKLIES